MMTSRAVLVAVSLLITGVTSLHAQQRMDCEHTRAIALSTGMSSSDALRVKAGAGSLEVRGVEGLREVRVRGTACASSAQRLREIDVTTRRDGGRVVVETLFNDDDWRSESAYIDLVIEVPAGVAANIADGSGSMQVRGLGDLEVTDGSGEIVISGITGSVAVVDGSGSVEVNDVTGDVTIEDGSGEISIGDVGGSVAVRDGSGSIDVRGVRGSFVVRSDGSGGIDWSGVSGRVEVPDRKRGRTD